MSYHQHKLFVYTKANDLLVGDAVAEADRTSKKIKLLQAQKILVPNWRLDIHCRDPGIVDAVIVIKLERGGALAPHEKYAIAVLVKPIGVREYEIPIAFFEHRKEADALLETIQAYLRLRYGI